MSPKPTWQSGASVSLRQLVTLTILLFFAALTTSEAGVACPCVDPDPACCPHQVGAFYVIVFLDEAEGDPADFVAQVKADPLLNEELGSPSDAWLATLLRPLPPGFTPEPGSPRDLLARYIDLEYPPTVKTGAVLDLLAADPRFGFVALESEEGVLSVAPNDPYYLPPPPPEDPHVHQQWAFEQLHFEDAWDITSGHAFIGVSDNGVEVPDPAVGTTQHPDLIGNYRPQHSYDYRCCDEFPREQLYGGGIGHGTHVAGLLAATTDNLLGVAGGCATCSLQVTSGVENGPQARAFEWMVGNGAQVLNMSGSRASGATNCSNTSYPICSVMTLLVQRDVALVAASGNHRASVRFPANDPRTIAVGGTDENGALWDRYPNCPFPENQLECGSNFGPEQDFVAPAKHVLSTFFTGAMWNAMLGCSDDPAHPNTYDPGGSFEPLGYDYCTGTSMSTPFVTDAMALVRSTNPLLSVAASKQALIDTTGQGGHNDTFGYGIPNVGAALREVLGKVGGNPGTSVKSRLTPLFALYSSPPVPDFLYTTVPQVAAGAVLGELHTPPTGDNMVAYGSAAVGDPVAGYPAFPLDSGLPSPVPTASAYIFTTEKNPFDPATPLLPLYRLSFAEDCDQRSHVYAVQQSGVGGVDYFTSGSFDWCSGEPGLQHFRLDGIEGYIFASCPPGFTCNDPQDPAQPQRLYRRRSDTDHGWALILERELNAPPYTTYNAIVGADYLGYVFPNDDSDGDGLIDGLEYVLSTDPSDANSDLDALSDSAEYPLTGLPADDPLYPEQVTCQVIRYDGFTGTLVNRWNGVGIAGGGSLSVPQDSWSSNPAEYGECPINEPIEFGYLQADVQGGASDQAYLIDTTPASEQVYRVGFWLNLDHAVMGANDNLIIFLARDVTPPPAKNVFYLVLGREQGDYFVWAVVYRNDGSTMTTRKVRVGVDPTALEVEWWASGARGAQAGGLRIRYNGEIEASTFLVDNGNLRVDTVMLGAVTGVDPGTSGGFAFNTFKSFRD